MKMGNNKKTAARLRVAVVLISLPIFSVVEKQIPPLLRQLTDAVGMTGYWIPASAGMTESGVGMTTGL